MQTHTFYTKTLWRKNIPHRWNSWRPHRISIRCSQNFAPEYMRISKNVTNRKSRSMLVLHISPHFGWVYVFGPPKYISPLFPKNIFHTNFSAHRNKKEALRRFSRKYFRNKEEQIGCHKHKGVKPPRHKSAIDIDHNRRPKDIINPTETINEARLRNTINKYV